MGWSSTFSTLTTESHVKRDYSNNFNTLHLVPHHHSVEKIDGLHAGPIAAPIFFYYFHTPLPFPYHWRGALHHLAQILLFLAFDIALITASYTCALPPKAMQFTQQPTPSFMCHAGLASSHMHA